MTVKVYLFDHRDYQQRDFTAPIEDLKKINPDKILLFCFEEFEPKFIFKNLIQILSPWLVENNKVAKVLKCAPGDEVLAPNIVTEKTSAFAQSLYGVSINFNNNGIDYTQIHLDADRLFTCYNSNPKFHRGLVIDAIARENLLQDCFLTMHFPFVYNNDDDNTPFEYKFYDKQIRTDGLHRHDAGFDSNNMAKSFSKGFFDLVTESTYRDLDKQYILSEKTAKSIFSLKPFIVAGTQHFHKFLYDEYGIEPYTEFFDYKFDSLPNIRDRVEGVIENIKRIKETFSLSEKNKIHDLLLPKMINNKNKLLNYFIDKDKMIPDSLNFLLTGEPYELYGDVNQCKYIFDFYKRMNWIN